MSIGAKNSTRTAMGEWSIAVSSLRPPEVAISLFFLASHGRVLNENEFRTLAAVVTGAAPTKDQIDELRSCIIKANMTKAIRVREITLDRVLECPMAKAGLASNARFGPTHELGDVGEVSFEMLVDDGNATLAKLDSVRARRTKFVCINDDMKHAPPGVQQLLQDFYLSFFPKPSRFELPNGASNPYLHWYALEAHLARKRWFWRIGWLLLAVLAAAIAAASVRARRKRLGIHGDSSDEEFGDEESGPARSFRRRIPRPSDD